MSGRVFATARVPEPGQTLDLPRSKASAGPADTGHVAVRPSWDCRECGQSWPCEPWREAISVEEGMTPTLLSITMAVYLQDAVGDGLYRVVPPEELYLRFIEWTRPAPPGTGGLRLP